MKSEAVPRAVVREFERELDRRTAHAIRVLTAALKAGGPVIVGDILALPRAGSPRRAVCRDRVDGASRRVEKIRGR
jgi:hypothetical protein